MEGLGDADAEEDIRAAQAVVQTPKTPFTFSKQVGGLFSRRGRAFFTVVRRVCVCDQINTPVVVSEGFAAGGKATVECAKRWKACMQAQGEQLKEYNQLAEADKTRYQFDLAAIEEEYR